jgi:putative ABC transport system permease protein
MIFVFRDLKIAVRHLSKSPKFSTTAVLMLALAIGATTAIFSLVESVLLRPLPFPEPNRLVVLSDSLLGLNRHSSTVKSGVTAPDIQNYVRDTHSFTSLGGYQSTTYEFSGDAGEPSTINAARMDSGVFPALGVQPLLGRVFTQEEDDKHQQVMLLSYATWQSRFQGDPKILGRKLLLNRKPYLVIGVMPRNFEFPLAPGHLNRSELWVPISLDASELAAASYWGFKMVGRLKPDVTSVQAAEDANRVAKETVRNYPAYMAGYSITAIISPLNEETIQKARPLVHVLFLAVAVVLLIACANLAGLLLVRSIRRRREIAVRIALGATSSTLLWQAILESLVLSLSGGILGLILAAIALHFGIQALPETLPRINEIGLDWHVVAFALCLAVFTGVLCGLAPAFVAIHTGVNDTLKEGGRTGTSGGGHARLRSALVISEIAVATILLAASGLLLRSFEKMRQVDLGYRPDHTLVANYSLPEKQYGDQTKVNDFNHELMRRLQSLPGVKSAGLTTFLPSSGANPGHVFVAEGHILPPSAGGLDFAASSEVQGDYFRALGIPLLHGRLFTSDDNAQHPMVVIVNHTLAQQSWPNQNPIGKRIRIGVETMKTPWAAVIGEVADVKESSPDLPVKQQYYAPVEQQEAMLGSFASPTDINGNSGYIVLRTTMDPEQTENLLRSTVHSIDPQLPLTKIESMEHSISESEAPRRFNTVLISSFAAIAVLLAALGIYSVIAFSVTLRVQEMAIRMALGSQRSGIVRLVALSGAKLAITGCAIGLAGALAASRLLKSFLFGVSAFDPFVFTLATISLLLLSLAASLLPASRATSVNLTEALRSE